MKIIDCRISGEEDMDKISSFYFQKIGIVVKNTEVENKNLIWKLQICHKEPSMRFGNVIFVLCDQISLLEVEGVKNTERGFPSTKWEWIAALEWENNLNIICELSTKN